MNRVKVLSLTVGLVTVVAGLAGCGGSSSSSEQRRGGEQHVCFRRREGQSGRVLDARDLVRQADSGIQRHADGQATSAFSQSYGASGDQSRAVEAGQPADYVHFALSPDIDRLVDSKLVSPDWDSGQVQGRRRKQRRRVRRAQGQPQAHHHLGRPRQARRPGDHARTRSPRVGLAGTSWPPTARRSKRARPPHRPTHT